MAAWPGTDHAFLSTMCRSRTPACRDTSPGTSTKRPGAVTTLAASRGGATRRRVPSPVIAHHREEEQPMPLRDWINRYPGVKRLLEQPGDVLEGISVEPPAMP